MQFFHRFRKTCLFRVDFQYLEICVNGLNKNGIDNSPRMFVTEKANIVLVFTTRMTFAVQYWYLLCLANTSSWRVLHGLANQSGTAFSLKYRKHIPPVKLITVSSLTNYNPNTNGSQSNQTLSVTKYITALYSREVDP